MKVEHADGLLRLLDAHGALVLEGWSEALLADGNCLSSRQSPDVVLRVRQLDTQVVQIEVVLRNSRDTPVRLERLLPLIAPNGYRALPLDRLRISQTGWQSWSPSHPPLAFAPNNDTAPPPIRAPILPHRQRTSQVVPWMTILLGEEVPPLLLGFASALRQLGTLEVWPTAAGAHALCASTELEGTALPPGAEVSSEPLLVIGGQYEQQIRATYARAVGEAMGARVLGSVPTGWCSWYQLSTEVTESDVRRNVARLAERRDLLPLDLVQLDDGYQHEVGDWLDVITDKFPSPMPDLVRWIRARDYVPGLWLAPFLLSARSRTYAEHPDWVVRDDADARPLNAIDNWGSPNYALDTTHPAAMAWLERVLRTVCDDWGYAYLKLDFLFAAAVRGRRHDPESTSVEAYRRGMGLVRRVAGDRFILGCGAPLVPSVGLVDGMRIGSDVAPHWRRPANDPLGPSTENAARATLARGWMHGQWWLNDPDCLLVRAGDTKLTPSEVQAWASLVALSGGILMVGGDVSLLEPERLAWLARLLPPSGQTAEVTAPLVNGMPERLRLRVQRRWSIVGIANWRDAPVEVGLDPIEWSLGAGRYYAFDLWSGAAYGPCDGRLKLGQLDPHGVRLLAIRPALDRPMLIGGTGHLLGDAMDILDEAWNGQTLTLMLTGTGPAGRRGELCIAEPSGAVRRVPFGGADRQPLRLSFG